MYCMCIYGITTSLDKPLKFQGYSMYVADMYVTEF